MYPGIIYDAKPKEVYVYVEWKDAADKSKGLEVKYVIAADGTDASTKSTLDFTNRYDNPGNTPGTPGTEPGGSDGTPGKPSDGKDDPSDPKADTDNPGSYTHILQVSKTVTGNQGSKINEFKFKVEIKPATTGTRKYAVYKTNAAGVEDSTPITITANETTAGSADILLKDGEKLTVYGLTKNDKYTVTEEETTTIKKYTTTISHDGTNMAGKTNLTANRTTDEITNDGSADAIEYVNDKSVTTPTGIVTEYAPYILLICAAGAFALIFLRKRNNREDY